MKSVLKWAGRIAAGLVVVVLFAIGGAFAASEVMVRWPVEKPQVRLSAATDPGAVARGRRVATLNGCHDCHGDKLQGRLFHDDKIVKAWGPNLTLLPDTSDAALDRAIRHGVGADGRRLWIMPANAYARLTDAETADLVAYIRTFQKTGEVQPRFKLSPMARIGVLVGGFKSEPDRLAAELKLAPADAGPAHARGRDLARLCVECHGPELKGDAFLRTPDLMVTGAYEAEDFQALMRTGLPPGGRHLGLMTEVSKTRFTALTPSEISALHGYLKARATLPKAQ